MSKKIDAAVEAVRDEIDRQADPKLMTLEEYDEFLDSLGSEIEGRVDCRKEEKENDGVMENE
jgi:hypothetical protein